MLRHTFSDDSCVIFEREVWHRKWVDGRLPAFPSLSVLFIGRRQFSLFTLDISSLRVSFQCFYFLRVTAKGKNINTHTHDSRGVLAQSCVHGSCHLFLKKKQQDFLLSYSYIIELLWPKMWIRHVANLVMSRCLNTPVVLGAFGGLCVVMAAMFFGAVFVFTFFCPWVDWPSLHCFPPFSLCFMQHLANADRQNGRLLLYKFFVTSDCITR